MFQFFNRVNFFNIVLLPLLILVYLYLGWNKVSLDDLSRMTGVINLGVWGTFNTSVTIDHILNFSIILLNAVLIAYVFNHDNFYNKTTLLPAFVYVIQLSNVNEFYDFNEALIFHTFLILALITIIKISESNSDFYGMFNFGFLVGVGATFEFNILFFIPLLYFLILLIKPFRMRAFFLYLTGFITPQLYGLFYLYFIRKVDLEEYIWHLYDFGQEWIHLFSYLNIAAVILLLFIVVFGAQGLSKKVGVQTTRQIRFFVSLSILFGFVGLFFLLAYKTTGFLHLLIVPLSLLFPILLLKLRNGFIYESFFYMMLVYSLIKYFFQ